MILLSQKKNHLTSQVSYTHPYFFKFYSIDPAITELQKEVADLKSQLAEKDEEIEKWQEKLIGRLQKIKELKKDLEAAEEDRVVLKQL